MRLNTRPKPASPETPAHPAIRLSAGYFESVQRHPVPLHDQAIAALSVSAILWNTRYLERALATLRQTENLPDHLLAHLSPLGGNT